MIFMAFDWVQVGGQVVEYYKQALRALDASNSREHGERIQDIVGNKQAKVWRSVLDFKVINCTGLSQTNHY